MTAGAFVAMSVLAGANAVGVRFSNRELAPLWGGGLRFGLAAVVLLVAAMLLRMPLPRGVALARVVLYGVLNFGLAFGLIYLALVGLQAGLGQTLLALVPLLTLMLAVAEHQERLASGALLGGLLAVVGVAVMSGGGIAQVESVLPVLAVVGAAALFAQGTIVLHTVPGAPHPVAVNAVAMAAGAPMLLVASLVADEPWSLPSRQTTWIALGYLVAIGSVLVFVLYAFLLERWPASRSAYVFVVIPLVTIALSALLDGERITPWLLVGGALILSGVYLGALRGGRGTVKPGEPRSGRPEHEARCSHGGWC